jgi:hypothetical protein
VTVAPTCGNALSITSTKTLANAVGISLKDCAALSRAEVVRLRSSVAPFASATVSDTSTGSRPVSVFVNV